MEDKKLGGAGLRGQVAGETALCTVGKSGTGLTYRGFDISVLAEHASFEEVAFLLLRGHLPNQRELEEYLTKIIQTRWLPEALKVVLERLPANAHPMDVMRTGCSMLGNLEPEGDFGNQQKTADRLLGALHELQSSPPEEGTARLCELLVERGLQRAQRLLVDDPRGMQARDGW